MSERLVSRVITACQKLNCITASTVKMVGLDARLFAWTVFLKTPAAIIVLVLLLATKPAFPQQASYDYDERGRLAAISYDNGVSVQFSYDDNGNLLQRQISVIEPSGILQFNMGTLSVNEDGGNITIMVQRLQGSNNAVSVAFATADITAEAGSDYISNNGTLNWPAGDTDDRMIILEPIADPDGEPDERFSLALSNPTGGAVLGPVTNLVITLLDDDERFFADGFEG